jgi:hypothetical protein
MQKNAILAYVYVLNPAKCVLGVPDKCASKARRLFPEIPPDGIRPAAKYLGGFIGGPAAVRQLLDAKVEDLCQQLTFYTDMAKSFPQSALSLVQYSLMQKVNHLQRVCPAAQEGLQVCEEQLRDLFSPSPHRPSSSLRGIPVFAASPHQAGWNWNPSPVSS